WLEEKKIPRPLGIVLIFLLLFTLIIAIIGSMVPVIIEQITKLLANFAEWALEFINNLQTEEGFSFLPEPYRTWAITALTSFNFETVIREILINLSSFTDQIKEIASGSLKTIGSTVAAGASVTASIASSLFNFLLIVLLTFFMVVDKGSLSDFFHSLFPKKYGSYISEKTHAIQKQIGAWMRGQLLLSLIMFLTTFIGLIIIGMGEYALTLALIMAIGEFIPYIGPMIFLLFALPVAFGISLAVIIKLLVFYAILQFVEGNIFVPAVMNKAVGLSPIVVLLVLIIGWQFLGIIGAIIAVPVTTAAAIFLSDYMKSIAKK
ncbi:AI-2E family transporter, partial [Candidatus Peregrinibacteria bacterium]|nr:AI-2E family transporter [Candidatus Peregrinibacteria bacterium]